MVELVCAQYREPQYACCHNLCSPISSARRGGSKVTTWTGRTFLFPATLLLLLRRDFALALFIPDPPPLVNSLQAEQCRTRPCWAGAGRSPNSLSMCPVFTLKPRPPSHTEPLSVNSFPLLPVCWPRLTCFTLSVFRLSLTASPPPPPPLSLLFTPPTHSPSSIASLLCPSPKRKVGKIKY